MTPERWRRIEETYNAALPMAPGERADFLSAQCQDDPDLRREVQALLDEPGGFLEQPAVVRGAYLLNGSQPSSKIGRAIGGYRVDALLGAGGMGEVYRARDPQLNRDVAIKVLPESLTAHPDRLARLEREARLLAALNHPGICGIYGIDEADGIRLLVLEYIEGETLAETLKTRVGAGGSALPLAEALEIARQIADALEVAHDKGIVHRDLKPANIKITPNGVVKILDFGLAKAVDGDNLSPDLTLAPATESGERRGHVMGTAAYMSPEQARGLAVDKRTDIWAFGCILFEMLTGRVTFAGDTAPDSIAKVLERDPDWSALALSTPLAIRRLLARTLAKDPKKRLRAFADVRLDLTPSTKRCRGFRRHRFRVWRSRACRGCPGRSQRCWRFG